MVGFGATGRERHANLVPRSVSSWPCVGGSGRRARHRRGGVLLAHIDYSFTHLGGGVNRTTSRKSCICSNAFAGDTGVSTPRCQSARSSVPSTRYSLTTI